MPDPKDPDKAYQTCPYNSSHRILKFRMSTHIVKCRKIHQGESAMTVCLFNANHSIPETELQYHLENCPDRFNLDKHVVVSNEVDHGRFPVHNVDVANEENWDDENCPSYQPEEYCKKNLILRQAKVESAATRKNFRNEERYRIQKLQEMGPSNTEANIMSPTQSRALRSAALANTATNVKEDAPYTYEDIQRIIQSRAPKAIITDPNCKATFVRANNTAEKPPDKEHFTAGNEMIDGLYSSTSVLLEPESDAPSQDGDEFITQKPKRKIGRGRGRGITR